MKINETVTASLRGWKHSGFSVDNSVCIQAGDHNGIQQLVEYVARCPFSLARMVSFTKNGEILYRAAHPNPVLSGVEACLPFPLSGDTTLMAGISRNFAVYDPLDFLAEVTQHIPTTMHSSAITAYDTCRFFSLELNAAGPVSSDLTIIRQRTLIFPAKVGRR